PGWRFPGKPAPGEQAAGRITTAVMMLVVMALSIRNPSGHLDIMRRLRAFNNLSPVIMRTVAARNIRNAVVFVDSSIGRDQWMSYGSVFPQNSIGFDGPVVYARYDGGELDRKVMAAYPDREYFVISYPKGNMRPYHVERLRRPGAGPGKAAPAL
ncbi:hypothetical protein JW905_09425, partial [bacterium]|nr:hypothetical protein [candidate division CSSED10-310 bacterium]